MDVEEVIPALAGSDAVKATIDYYVLLRTDYLLHTDLFSVKKAPNVVVVSVFVSYLG